VEKGANHKKFTLKELAERLEGEVVGDGARTVKGVRGLEEAGPDEISFLANPKYRSLASSSGAGALIARRDFSLPGKDLLLVDDPYFAFARVMQLFHPAEDMAPGIGPGSHIGENAVIASSAAILPGVYIGADTEIGEKSVIHPGCVIMGHCRIGDRATLYPNITIYPGTRIGNGVTIHAGSVIGSDGFGYALHRGVHHKIPQTGGVKIGDDVEIGSNVSIDRGTFGDTVIGEGTKIDNLVQIAHNCVLGKNVIIVSMVGLSGSTVVGDQTVFAGQSATAGHLKVGKNVTITGKTGVTKNIPDNVTVSGLPAIDHNRWKRIRAVYLKLPEILERIKKLEKKSEK
jgi:UDP-3-O-[3-hydroxymyristoyl] glucosamine N-acyltransferase